MKRLIGRPQESALSERKSTPLYGEVPFYLFLIVAKVLFDVLH
ncbi:MULTISPECIES: hypothetical protein [Lysinibacillus]|nr:hypothetical protein [Lysinibacillus sphaericus]